MSNSSHSSAHHGVAVGYPAASVASSSMSPAPAYMPMSSLSSSQFSSYPTATAVSQPADVYRAGSVGSGAPMALPSMRTIDALSQQPVSQPPPPHHAMSMGMTPPLASTSSGQTFYAHHSLALPSSYGLPHEPTTRYPIPHDPRILGSRGPKKEIKRRTKTGCLTCRKRRIKCDETHPTCNNCKKSKRECLGYDPIFRTQAGVSPANSHIQPAPASQPTVLSPVPPSTAPHSTPPPGARLGNSYGSQPSSMLPSAYASSPATTLSSTPNSHAPTTAGYNSPIPAAAPPTVKADPLIKADSGYEHSSAVDPSARNLSSTSLLDSSRPLDHRPTSFPGSGLHLRAKKMKINEIIDLLGPPPPPQQISHTEDTFNEITKVYHEMYAGGLGAFLESTWYYFAENGKMTFPKDANLIEHMASFLKILEAVKANDHVQMAYSGVLETRIVWELACTAYQTTDRTNSAMRMALPPEGDATEVRNRLHVIETLLCGDYLVLNPLAVPVADQDQHRTRQFDFWYSLAEFVRKRDNPNSPQAVKAREDMLARMRHLLDGRENRDVLYSIAVVRELAPNFDAGYGNTIPQHLDETDPKNRLAVASKFILDEAQVTGGTTNVVRRFSDIAARAFVNPGVNVVRRV
ncbi:Uncharacterized protein TCAP_06687 [Tolypocladium capitatum]|uniref:Zn(2)-C6 fungal-type domain-containing protein n=1 Tax=Tolypocladium capitatum TaxID=45235 RepID=A0A2K3Q704_9HYPO|nr:Uncharacterized protein TCAP_06687 [Tolypocladium capitatum]